MLGAILLIFLVIVFIGGLPAWQHSREWGYAPSTILGTILVIYLALVLIGIIPIGL